MTEPVQEPAASTDHGHGAWWLGLRVFDEPGVVFSELVQKPRVLVPILFLFLVSPVLIAIGTPASVFREQVEQRLDIQESRSPGSVSAEDREQALAEADSPVKRALIVGASVVFGPIILAIVALVLQLIFNALAPEGVKFKQEMAVVAHAWMPQFLGAIVLVILTVGLGMEQLQLSLGFLFAKDQSSFLYNFANGITIFGTWSMVLVAVGNQHLTKAKTLGTSLVIVAGLWIGVKLAGAALASFLAGLAGG